MGQVRKETHARQFLQVVIYVVVRVVAVVVFATLMAYLHCKFIHTCPSR